MKKIKRITLGLMAGYLMVGAMPVQAQTGSAVPAEIRPEAQGRSRMLYVEFYPSQAKAAQDLTSVYRIPLSSLPLPAAKSESLDFLEPYAAPLALKGTSALDNVFVLYVKDGQDVADVVDRLEKLPTVKNVEITPEYTFLAMGPAAEGADASAAGGEQDASKAGKATNDPYYDTYMDLDLKWHLDLVKAESAWSLQSASPAVKVAVIDNAIWGEHPDLQIPKENQYNTATGEQTSSPLDLGLDLQQDEICDQSALDYYTCASYNWSHGTHVAGLIGALNNNGEGVASLGSGLELLAVAVPSMSTTELGGNPYDGMRWAVNQGAKVLNCSWVANVLSEYEEEMLQAWVDQGIIIVANAGDMNRYYELNYPAAFPGVISVGACNYDKTRAEGSNYGGWVDVMAPGGVGPTSQELVFSTMFGLSQVLPNAGYEEFAEIRYDYMRGTSMATPMVSALCALILSKDSTVTPWEMEELLMTTAQGGQNLGIMESSGIIDAEAALNAVGSRIRRVQPDYIASLYGVCESGIAKLYWEVDADAADKPDFLRLYRNGLMVSDSLPYADGSYRDAEVPIASNHRYELCGIKDGVESYREPVFLTIDSYYELRASAQPEEGGRVYGSGRYEPRSQARLIAESNPGYHFVEWTYYDLWTGEEYLEPTLIVDMNQSYLGVVARFERDDVAAEEDDTQADFRVYPNPVSGQLSWSLPAGEWEKLEVRDNSGRCVAVLDPEVGSQNVSFLASGLYILQAYAVDGKVTTLKFIKR